MAGTITAADAVFMLSVQGLFPNAQKIQGFGVDDAFTADDIDTAELQMGVDGFLAAGWIPQMRPMRITLLAASPSIGFFETWDATETSGRVKLPASGTISLRSTGAIYTLVQGFLTRVSPMASAGKVLKQREWTLNWQSITVAPQ